MNQVPIGSNNGLSPIRRQAITYTNAGLLSMRPLGTGFSEILIKIQNFPLTKMHLKITSVKWRPFCPGGDELTQSNKARDCTKLNLVQLIHYVRHCDKTIWISLNECDDKKWHSFYLVDNIIGIFQKCIIYYRAYISMGSGLLTENQLLCIFVAVVSFIRWKFVLFLKRLWETLKL